MAFGEVVAAAVFARQRRSGFGGFRDWDRPGSVNQGLRVDDLATAAENPLARTIGLIWCLSGYIGNTGFV